MISILSLIILSLVLASRADINSIRPSVLAQYFSQDDNILGLVDNHGCGPNPLLTLLSDMPSWLQKTIALSTSRDMIRTIRSDGTILREFLEFKRILMRFKDCVKTGEGIRAKKSMSYF